MNDAINGALKFFSTNLPPTQDKILISLLVVLIFSFIIFMLSWFLHELKTIDILNIKKYNLKNGFFWLSGSMFVQFILITTKIINYNILSFLAVAMIWDKMYQKIFNQAKEGEISGLESIEGEPKQPE